MLFAAPAHAACESTVLAMDNDEPLVRGTDAEDSSDVELERDSDERSRALHSQQPDLAGPAPGERLSDAVSKGLGMMEEGSSSPSIAAPSATITQRTNASSSQSQPRHASPDRHEPSLSRRASSTGISFSSAAEAEDRVCWNHLSLPFFNVLCMSFAFMLLFSAFNTVQGFCTSLLPDGLGNISLTVCYATVVVVVIFAPAIVRVLGEPLAMLMGAGCYCVYMSSLIASDRTLLLVCSVVLGFGGSVLWVSSATYLTRCSAEHERARNTGIFWSLFQMSAVIGNLSAYAIFQHVTSTQLFTVLCIVGCCGAAMLLLLKPLPERFYPKDNSIYSSGAPVGAGMGRRNSTSYLAPASGGGAAAAATTAAEVSINISSATSSSGSANSSSDAEDDAESDGLRNRDQPSTILPLPPTTAVHPLVVPLPVVLVPTASSAIPAVSIAVAPSVSSLVAEVLGMFGDSRLLLLMPLMLFLGLEFSFWTGEFPQLLPKESIGLVLCTAGIMEVAGGVGLGLVSARWGRSVALLLGSFVFSIGLYLSSNHLMFHDSVAPAWQDVKAYAYVSAACFGLGDAAFNTQIFSLIGAEFSRGGGESRATSAFAVFNFVVNVGMASGFFYGLAVPMHSAKGTRTQVIVQLVMLVVASTGFVVCERKCEQRRIRDTKARRHSSSSSHEPSTAHSVQ